MIKPYVEHEEATVKSLGKDPAFAAEYLSAVLEDAEDIAYIESLTPEDRANAVPFEEVIKDYEAKYGPLYQD
jgi:DNA-binding phage protein